MAISYYLKRDIEKRNNVERNLHRSYNRNQKLDLSIDHAVMSWLKLAFLQIEL